MAHTSPYLFFLLSNCTYNGHKMKNENFLAYFMCILNSCVIGKCELSTLGVHHPSRIPSDRCNSARHSGSLVFLQL